MGHRFYDPTTGRFLSPDPVHDGENWYAYCGNNPLGKIDITGESMILMTGEIAAHDNVMAEMDDLYNGYGTTIMQAGPTESPGGQAEAAAAAKDAGEAGNTGLGKPGKIELPTYDQARNKALKWLEERGFRAEKPTSRRFPRSQRGTSNGKSTADGKTGFRVEHDARSGAHINVYHAKEVGPHFSFRATWQQVEKIIERFNR